MLTDREQVPAVARDERIRFRLNRTREDQVVVWVSRDRLGRIFGRWDQFGRKIDEELLDLFPALRLEAQLAGEDSLQLDHHRLGQDEFQAGVDRLFEDPAGRSGGDEGRD